MNNGKYLEGHFMNKRVLYHEYPQVRNDGRSTIIKRKIVRVLNENEKVVNGKVEIIEESSE